MEHFSIFTLKNSEPFSNAVTGGEINHAPSGCLFGALTCCRRIIGVYRAIYRAKCRFMWHDIFRFRADEDRYAKLDELIDIERENPILNSLALKWLLTHLRYHPHSPLIFSDRS